MKGLFRFLKSTILGGLLVVVPLAILGAIVTHVVVVIGGVVSPALELLPVKSVGAVSLSLLVACLVLLLACFLAGLLAELALAQRVLRSVESLILAKIPGYTLMKSVGENLLGVEGQEDRQTVLVRFERTSQIGFLMSTLPDGRLVVFVPNVPHAMSGTLHIVEPECAEPLPLKIGDTLHTLGRLGADLGNAWAAAPLGAIPSQHPTPTHDEPRPLPRPIHR
jgi:uncharacterized membrane protein